MNALRPSAFFVLVALASLSTSPTAIAQQFPSQQRGLSADTAFQIGAVDHVNLFNGALTLTLPLSQTYPVGPNLSYSLILSYSSNGWDYVDAECFDDIVMRYHVPVQSPHTNAGFGWRLTPGKLSVADEQPVVPAGAYVGPDGSEHGFFDELHPGYPATAQPDTTFSNDATYLRRRYYSARAGVCTSAPGAGSQDCYQIEFPDGTVHEFHWFLVGGRRDWLLTRMMDRFEHDHWVSFNYSTANEWNVSDSHGRQHKVTFASGRVSQVEVAAFGGATATTSLTYTQTPIARQNFFPPDCDNTVDPLTVPLLTRVELADGSFYEMSYQTSTGGDLLSGGIESLRLPTGGELRWDYRHIDFVTQTPQMNGIGWARSAWGVATKELYTVAGNASSKQGEWSYDYQTVGNPPEPTDPDGLPCFHTVTVTDPLGNATVHYFDSSPVGRWQYGLSFRRCDVDDGQVLTPPYPSQEIWDGTPDTGTKLRTVYVEYDSDGRDGGPEQNKNHRLRLRRVEYEDDPGFFQQTVYSDFDGLGHFRTMTTTGNLAGGELRTVFTEYNEGSGTLLLDPEDSTPLPGNDFVMPGVKAPWVLETFTRREVTENGDTAKTELCFDESTGFLERSRTLTGANRSATDVLRVFEEETIGGQGTGRVAAESSYGGDPGGISTADLCTLVPPAEAQHKVEHTYRYGVLESSTVVDACDDSEILILSDHDIIDLNTGFVRRSRDSAGVATVQLYDVLGRPVLERPETSARTVTTYQLPTVSQPGLAPLVTVYQCPNTDDCTSDQYLSWQRSTFDGLGRRIREGREVLFETGVAPIARTFGYNAMGWKIAESLWGDTDTTSFLHDRFGRVVEVDPADTSLAKTLFVYQGDRRIERTESVATMLGEEPNRQRVCRRESYDVFGRLVRVAENLASDGDGNCSSATGLLTLYSYDEADRLVHVCGRGNTGGCVQERAFTYDNRGFLLSETHPEIGPSGNGETTYTYDASGNVLRKDIAGSNDFSLRYRYDPANRMIGLDEVLQTNPLIVRPLKEFQYARANAGNDRRAGKLVTSKRVNWVDAIGPLAGATGSVAASVTQSYRYEGRDGRVSARQTRANFGTEHYAFLTELVWDFQGNLESLKYPRCLHHPCVGNDVTREVEFNYQRGFLSQVEGYASLAYQLGGMLHKVEHANGVTETIETKATFPMLRPHRISTSGVAGGENWDTGVYLYDGGGNVKAIGTQRYQYDRMSRLLEGQVEVDSLMKSQELQYDAFGNILRLITEGSVETTPVNDATNRLSAATYDAGGNLTNLTVGGESYQYTYDPLNAMKYLQSTDGQARVFLYDADDERLLAFDCAFVQGKCGTEAQVNATVRGLDAKVLRVYEYPFYGRWNWKRDYVYRDGQLLASVELVDGAERTLHFHLDHLGSPRQITTESATQAAFHTYYPFGGEATDPFQNDIRLRFTGHERDIAGSDGAAVLDYMHARYCSPNQGRFVSVDPVVGTQDTPQSWNRYSYVRNNPARYVDPTGEESFQIYLDIQLELALESGQDPYFRDPTLQKVAIGAAALATPGPDEILLGAAFKASSKAGGLLSRIGNFVKKLFGKKDTNSAKIAPEGRASSSLARQSRRELLKSKESFEQLIKTHRQKLEDFKADPFAVDNKGTLRNAPQELRPRIIEGRIRVIERQIRKQEGELQKILQLLNEAPR